MLVFQVEMDILCKLFQGQTAVMPAVNKHNLLSFLVQTGILLLQPLIRLTVEPLCYARMTHLLLLQGYPPLTWVACGGHTHAAELLLAKRADVNIQDHYVSSRAPARAFEMCFGQ